MRYMADSGQTTQPPTLPARTRQMSKVDWVIAGLVALGILIGIVPLVLAVVILLGALPLSLLQGVGGASSLAAESATVLLAVFTGLLAWVTRRSIEATQREANIAAAALAASIRQADVAEKALRAVQDQATIAERQVSATNEQARIAQEQLAVSTRPLLAEPRETYFVSVAPNLNQPYGFELYMVNIGPGPAFVKKGLFNLGAAMVAASDIRPKIIKPNGVIIIAFTLDPKKGVDIAITNALLQGSAQLTAGALYHDISGERAWRSRGRLAKRGTNQWLLVDVEVETIALNFLD